MIATHQENGWGTYGNKGTDVGSKWKAGAGCTEIGLDGWCEGDLASRRMTGEATQHCSMDRSGKPRCI